MFPKDSHNLHNQQRENSRIPDFRARIAPDSDYAGLRRKDFCRDNFAVNRIRVRSGNLQCNTFSHIFGQFETRNLKKDKQKMQNNHAQHWQKKNRKEIVFNLFRAKEVDLV